MRTAARVVLVLVTALVAAVLYLPAGNADYTSAWRGGTYGVSSGTNTVSSHIASVAPNSPAARAGVRPGDTVVVPPFSRVYPHLAYPLAGTRESFQLRRPDGTPYAVTMTAVPFPGFTLRDRILGVLALLPATIFIVIAFVLVFMRPDVMTWSFYAFAAGYISTTPSFGYFVNYLPETSYAALTFVLSTAFGNFAVLPLLPFVVRFPDDKLTGAWRTADRIIWIVIALAFAAYTLEWYDMWSQAQKPGDLAALLDEWLPLATFAAATAILVRKYKVATPQLRQRFGFLMLGLIVSFVAYAIYFVPGVPPALAQVIGGLVVVMPITVIYAVLKHRVFDINFVLNRALAYSLLSIFVIAFVSLLDWGAGHAISGGRFAVWLELAITIAVGFLLDRINKLIERTVEAVFFRKRRDAERFLRKTARALPYATDESAVNEGLTQIPVNALALAAAALYRRSDTADRFEGLATSSNTTVAPPGFDCNHLLVRLLQSSEAPVWLEEVRDFLDPHNAGIYVLAVPVTVRHELVSFVLYGAHANGSQIDPDEVELLEELALEASRAYDHIEAVRVRERYTPAPLPIHS